MNMPLDQTLKMLIGTMAPPGDHKIFNGSNPDRENLTGLGRLLQPIVQKNNSASSHQILNQNTGGLTATDGAEDGEPRRLQGLQNKRPVRLRILQPSSGAAVYGTCSSHLGRVKRKIEDERQLDAIICKKDLAIGQTNISIRRSR
jgi:hypothetical protein